VAGLHRFYCIAEILLKVALNTLAQLNPEQLTL
jgi:hypothetical protein